MSFLQPMLLLKKHIQQHGRYKVEGLRDMKTWKTGHRGVTVEFSKPTIKHGPGRVYSMSIEYCKKLYKKNLRKAWSYNASMIESRNLRDSSAFFGILPHLRLSLVKLVPSLHLKQSQANFQCNKSLVLSTFFWSLRA